MSGARAGTRNQTATSAARSLLSEFHPVAIRIHTSPLLPSALCLCHAEGRKEVTAKALARLSDFCATIDIFRPQHLAVGCLHIARV